MNQILVTEKIYVTPELKRKKKMYKLMFVIIGKYGSQQIFCLLIPNHVKLCKNFIRR